MKIILFTSSMAGKYIVGISTAGSNGADAVAKMLTQIAGGYFGWGMVSGTLAVLRHGKRVEEMPKALSPAKQLGGKLAMDVASKRQYPLQNLVNRAI